VIGRTLRRSIDCSSRAFQRRSIVISPLCGRITRQTLSPPPIFFLRRITPLPLRRLAGGGKLLLAYQGDRISTVLPCAKVAPAAQASLSGVTSRPGVLTRRRSRQRLVQLRALKASGRLLATSHALSRGRAPPRLVQGPVSLRVRKQMWKFLRCNQRIIVHCSLFIVHLSLWNGAAPAMTNEQSTMNNEQ
jgi:hypothetical protein